MRALFVHCNGGHYFRSTTTHCPDSGYTHELVRELLDLAERAREPSYQALLDAGASEGHLMHALFVPLDLEGEPWRCSGIAPPQLVELVLVRNRWLLERFPTGLLAASLIPEPRVDRTYCRTCGDTFWTLVDRSSFRLADPSARRSIQSLLAGEGGSVEVRSVSVGATYPPLMISDGLINKKTRDHLLVPQGHLWLGFEQTHSLTR